MKIFFKQLLSTCIRRTAIVILVLGVAIIGIAFMMALDWWIFHKLLIK